MASQRNSIKINSTFRITHNPTQYGYVIQRSCPLKIVKTIDIDQNAEYESIINYLSSCLVIKPGMLLITTQQPIARKFPSFSLSLSGILGIFFQVNGILLTFTINRDFSSQAITTIQTRKIMDKLVYTVTPKHNANLERTKS